MSAEELKDEIEELKDEIVKSKYKIQEQYRNIETLREKISKEIDCLHIHGELKTILHSLLKYNETIMELLDEKNLLSLKYIDLVQKRMLELVNAISPLAHKMKEYDAFMQLDKEFREKYL